MFSSYWLRLVLASTLIVAGASMARGADLRTVFTDHYAIHTDLDVDLTQNLERRMDAMWEDYALRLHDFPLPDVQKKFDAYLFTRKADYIHLTGDRFQNTGGVFDSGKQLLAAYLEGQGRDGLRQILQHEAFHQFAFTAVGPHLPVWLNEGLAQIFEEGIWTGDRFVLGQLPPHRVTLIQNAINTHKLIDFKTFLATTDKQWLSNLREKSRATAQYNQAWAMTQFLLYSRDPRGNPLYEDNLLEMLRLVHHGCGGRSAFEQAFSDNYAGFQRVFTEWAHSISPTAQASCAEQQNVLADLMVELYGNGKRFDNLQQFRSYLADGDFYVHSIPGRPEMLAANYFCGPGGKPLAPDQLFFADRIGAPTPDIIYRPGRGIELHTRFLQDADALSYETTLESW